MANLPGGILPGGYYAIGLNAPTSEPAGRRNVVRRDEQEQR